MKLLQEFSNFKKDLSSKLTESPNKRTTITNYDELLQRTPMSQHSVQQKNKISLILDDANKQIKENSMST